MPTDNRRVGKLLPSPVTPASTVCFTIQIPDAVPYRAALFGVLGQLGEWWTWDHPTDGTVCEDCEEAAQLWRDAIAGATFSDDCEIPMSCLDVADCIENNTVVQNAINNIVTNISTPGVISTPGEPLTPQLSAAALNPMDGCDWDVLWAQITQFVTYITTAGTDLLNKIETYSDSLEAATFIELAPVIGSIIDEIQLDKALQLIDWVVETAGEFYAAANNEPAREQLACDFFCAAKPDCVISIDLVWNVLNERLGGALNPGDITTFEEFVNTLLTIVGNEDIALDLWLVSLTGFAKFLGYLGVRGLDETLRLVLLLAADEPSNNWEVLCTECAEPPTELIPVIDPNGMWLEASPPVGTIEGPDEDGYFTATAELQGGSWKLGLAATGGATFVVVDASWIPGVACWGYTGGTTTYFNSCIGNAWSATTDTMTRIAAVQGGPFQFRLKITAP